jgi:RNA polymerase sigma factor (sigma-70 family)
MNRQLIVDQIPSLRRYARALTGNSWAADDLVQDTLERACHKWRLWRVGSDLRAWLFTVMHNVYVNQVRKASRQNQAPVFDVDDVAHELIAPSSTGATLDLQRCLARLPEEQRAVLLLVGVEEMSYVEVAGILAIPLGTVMSRLSRARHRLQEMMDAPASSLSRSEVKPASSKTAPILQRLK